MADDTDLRPFALPPYSSGRPGAKPPPPGPRSAYPQRPSDPVPALAPLGRRAAAIVIDFVITLAMFAPAALVVLLATATASPVDDAASLTGPSFTGGEVVGLLLVLVGLVTAWWHIGWRQGEHGQTWGKQAVGIALVSARSFEPPGGGRGLARALVRAVLSSICYGVYGVVTVLWPLWDERRQTLDDKIFDTLVVRWR